MLVALTPATLDDAAVAADWAFPGVRAVTLGERESFEMALHT